MSRIYIDCAIRGSPPPILMSDTLACNFCEESKRVVCKRLVHARRKFVEVRKIYPVGCTYLLKQIGEIYRNEKQTAGMRDEERLVYHQQQSGTVMAELKQWTDEQMAEKKVEPNSSLGKAIDYFLSHYEGLSAYLRYAGVPLDNNACEQVLRPVVIIRKNLYGDKINRGADARKEKALESIQILISALLSLVWHRHHNGFRV
jgi:transposase